MIYPKEFFFGLTGINSVRKDVRETAQQHVDFDVSRVRNYVHPFSSLFRSFVGCSGSLGQIVM